ncbi:hypothetical protein M0805_003004 [Coniferiporia weirii]|nr:hypothetical protein M0805_003004 [Coniferiporia weirii]
MAALSVAFRNWRPRSWQTFPSTSHSFTSPGLTRVVFRIGASSAAETRTLSQRRLYASKAKSKQTGKDRDNSKSGRGTSAETRRGGRGVDTAALVPGSQQVLTGDALAEHARADTKMGAALEWLRRAVAGMEAQGAGRVTPDILRPVRVALPGMPEGETCALAEVATVGVREGTTLLVTVFAEDTLKHVEKAIYTAQIPHVVPQKLDNRTIKIPMPKPTVAARADLAKAAAKTAEDTRVQLRRLAQASVKKGAYEKRSLESDEFHELLQRHLKDVDTVLGDLKRNLGVK